MFSLLEVESSSCRVELTSTKLFSGPSDTSAVMGDTFTASSPIPECPCSDTGSSWPWLVMEPVSTTLTTPEFNSPFEWSCSPSPPAPPPPAFPTRPPMWSGSITTGSSSTVGPWRGITPPDESRPSCGWGCRPPPSCCWVSGTTPTPSIVASSSPIRSGDMGLLTRDSMANPVESSSWAPGWWRSAWPLTCLESMGTRPCSSGPPGPL